MTFSERLMGLRKAQGWSQEELGSQLNVSRQTVSKWELGQTTPEMQKLVELSKLFDVSLDCLIAGGQTTAINKDMQFSYRFRQTYEYKSKKMLWGLPLIHINLGYGFRWAKGIIAIGQIATGLISIGAVSIGALSFGCLSFGLLFSFGCLCLGAVSIAAVAVGYIAVGSVAIGLKIALGAYAKAKIAIGEVANGQYEFDTTGGFTQAMKQQIKQTIFDVYPRSWVTWFLK